MTSASRIARRSAGFTFISPSNLHEAFHIRGQRPASEGDKSNPRAARIQDRPFIHRFSRTPYVINDQPRPTLRAIWPERLRQTIAASRHTDNVLELPNHPRSNI